MTEDEIKSLAYEPVNARARVSEFFNEVIRSHRRGHFVDCAKRHFPELFDEVEGLKAQITNPQTSWTRGEYLAKCRRFEKASKELIRRAGFILARSVLP